ncbi:D-hexose-6-phosphate mutarotase [Undibacterium sp. SXout7W]|uniref:D-hexose-6-phosphate mutarotase n=1 Tax=Undibacterium sp. SXout7W TaxID=3413049 RepID=UPI003BF38419
MTDLILTASDGAAVRIASQGAHVCSWIPAGGTEQLFLSKTSGFAPGVAIRGGVPVIFPQFAGLGTLPKHGFARTSEWRLLQSGLLADGSAEAVYELRENIARLTIWPHVFRATFKVTVGAARLQMALAIDNTGDTTFQFTSALHTYLAVDDLRQARVQGLQGLQYRDSVSGAQHCTEHAALLQIEGETDRIYGAVPEILELQQPHQTLRIHARGFADAVIWNPGQSAGKLSDLDSGGEQRMLCIEAATILQPVCLTPGAQWSGSQTLEVFPTAS